MHSSQKNKPTRWYRQDLQSIRVKQLNACDLSEISEMNFVANDY